MNRSAKKQKRSLLNFAEFERETGIYQGGKMYYGFNSERRTVNGKNGSVLVSSGAYRFSDVSEYYSLKEIIVILRMGRYKFWRLP